MNTLDKIFAEVRRRLKVSSGVFEKITPSTPIAHYYKGSKDELEELLAFLDNLKEQEPQGLNEAAEKYAFVGEGVDVNGVPYKDYDSGKLEGFKAGAEWMAQQIKN